MPFRGVIMANVLSISSKRSLALLLHGFGLGVAVVIIAAVGLTYRAVQARVADMRSEQQQATRLLRQARDVHRDHEELTQRLEFVRAELDGLRAFYPETLNETEVLEQVSTLCDKAELALHDFHPGATADFPTHKELEVRFHCDGAYAGICRFLAGLEEFPFRCRISHLNVAAPTAPGQHCGLDLQLRLSFALKEKSLASQKP
jgi:hypothetical protein